MSVGGTFAAGIAIALLFFLGNAATAKIIIIRARDSGAGCETSVDDGRFRPDKEAVATLARLKRAHPRATIRINAGIDTSWRCLGAVMTNVGRAGFPKAGFIAAPPADR